MSGENGGMPKAAVVAIVAGVLVVVAVIGVVVWQITRGGGESKQELATIAAPASDSAATTEVTVADTPIDNGGQGASNEAAGKMGDNGNTILRKTDTPAPDDVHNEAWRILTEGVDAMRQLPQMTEMNDDYKRVVNSYFCAYPQTANYVYSLLHDGGATMLDADSFKVYETDESDSYKVSFTLVNGAGEDVAHFDGWYSPTLGGIKVSDMNRVK